MESFYLELDLVEQNSVYLPPQAFYIAGSTHHRTNLSPVILLKFLQVLYRKSAEFHL